MSGWRAPDQQRQQRRRPLGPAEAPGKPRRPAPRASARPRAGPAAGLLAQHPARPPRPPRGPPRCPALRRALGAARRPRPAPHRPERLARKPRLLRYQTLAVSGLTPAPPRARRPPRTLGLPARRALGAPAGAAGAAAAQRAARAPCPPPRLRVTHASAHVWPEQGTPACRPRRAMHSAVTTSVDRSVWLVAYHRRPARRPRPRPQGPVLARRCARCGRHQRRPQLAATPAQGLHPALQALGPARGPQEQAARARPGCLQRARGWRYTPSRPRHAAGPARACAAAAPCCAPAHEPALKKVEGVHGVGLALAAGPARARIQRLIPPNK